jgi:hypothetical protein
LGKIAKAKLKTCEIGWGKYVNKRGVSFSKKSLATTICCGLLTDAPYKWGIEAWREAYRYAVGGRG